MAQRTLLLLNKKIINIMGTYLYNGHKVDLFNNPVTGFVAYVDDDLEQHDTTEDEALTIIQNGVRI